MNYLITGGTGFLGRILVKEYIKNNRVDKVIVYSRRWNDQEKLRDEIERDPQLSRFLDKLRLITGDVRDKSSLMSAMKGVTHVIHTAAYKHVTFAEYNPREVIGVNIDGSQNVIDCAIANNVEKVLAISTDKATDAYNLYGRTKAVMESMMVAANNLGSTCFNVARYGNVWGSTGSVVEKWTNQIKGGSLNIKITDPTMTRFFIFQEELIKYMKVCMSESRRGIIMMPVMKAVTVDTLSRMCAKANKNQPFSQQIVGARAGEKKHESLLSDHEIHQAYQITGRTAGIFPSSPQWGECEPTSKETPVDVLLFRSDTAQVIPNFELENAINDMVQ